MKPLFVWKTCKSLWNFGETIKYIYLYWLFVKCFYIKVQFYLLIIMFWILVWIYIFEVFLKHEKN
jgi:hypothetical protein